MNVKYEDNYVNKKLIISYNININHNQCINHNPNHKSFYDSLLDNHIMQRISITWCGQP